MSKVGPKPLKVFSAEERALLESDLNALSKSKTQQTIYFYASVGQGISVWGDMEESLIAILARLLRTTDAKAGLVAYSIINFHVWLQIIEDLFVLDGTYPRSLKAWRKIMKPLKAENDIRFRLAHHALRRDRLKEQLTGLAEAYLRPSDLDVRTKIKRFKPLSAIEIMDFSARVLELRQQLRDMLRLMKKRKSLR